MEESTMNPTMQPIKEQIAVLYGLAIATSADKADTIYHSIQNEYRALERCINILRRERAWRPFDTFDTPHPNKKYLFKWDDEDTENIEFLTHAELISSNYPQPTYWKPVL